MATTYTTNARLPKPAANDRTWSTPILAMIDGLDALSPVGGLCVAVTESPSTTLNVWVAAGKFTTPWGAVVTYAGTASRAMTTAATNYVYLTTAGVLTVSTTAFPATPHVPLATVVAGATTITSVADARVVCATVVPNTQTTGGAATADLTYSSNEQTMLNQMWTALRNAGILT